MRNALAFAAAAAALALPAAAQEWTPLDGARWGSELGEAWVPVPDGSSGAPRQGWLGTADGFFTREAHLAYDWIDSDAGEAHRVLGRLHYPLTRRLWIGAELPYVDTEAGSGFGDLAVNTQLMLAETRDVSVNFGLGFELPTGEDEVGAGESFGVSPQLNLWTDVGGGVSIRGRVAYAFRDDDATDGFALNAAIGRTVNGPEDAPLGQFTWYLAANWFSPDDGENLVSVTPGIRTRLTSDLFFLAGLELPDSEDEPFDRRIVLQLVKGF